MDIPRQRARLAGTDFEQCFLCIGIRRRIGIDAIENATLLLGPHEELALDNRATHSERMTLGDRCHQRRDFTSAHRDSVGVDASVEHLVSAAALIALSVQMIHVMHEPALMPSPPVSRDCFGLSDQFFRSQQTLATCIAQCRCARRIVPGHRLRPEPRRQHDLYQEVLGVVRVATVHPCSEGLRESRDFGILKPRPGQASRGISGCAARGEIGDLGSGDDRPPELDDRLGESGIGRDLLHEPLQAVFGSWGASAVESGRGHVSVPGIPFAIPGNRVVLRVLVRLGQRIPSAEAVPVRAVLGIVLERAGYRIQLRVTGRASRIVARRVIRTRDIGRAQGRFLNIEP